MTLNKAHIKRRAAVVHTMLPASVQLSVLLCTAVSCILRSSKKQLMPFLVPIFGIYADLRICISCVRTLSIDLRILGTTLRIYTKYIVNCRLQLVVHGISSAQVTTKQQQQQQVAAAENAGREPLHVAVRVTCGFGRATRRVFVCFSCFVSCQNLPSYHTNEERIQVYRCGSPCT